MSKARVAVLKVVTKELSVTAAAARYGYSRQHLHRLLARYREGGIDAVDPRSRRPRSNSAATPDAVRERIIELRLTGEVLSTHQIQRTKTTGATGRKSRAAGPGLPD